MKQAWPNPTQLNLVPQVGFIGRVDLDLNFILSIVLYWVQVDDFFSLYDITNSLYINIYKFVLLLLFLMFFVRFVMVYNLGILFK